MSVLIVGPKCTLAAFYGESRLRGTAVERLSLAGELFLSCARPVADG